MLKVETLNGYSHNEFPEPDGEVLHVVEHNKRNNLLTVLTRVEEQEEDPAEVAQPVESPPIDPSELSVSDLRLALTNEDYDWTDAALRGLLQSEKGGKDRSSAINSIEEALA